MGVPLLLYQPEGAKSSVLINYMSDLNKEITIASLGNQGWMENGFNNGNNLKEIWANCKYINTSSGIHALTTTELIETYNILMNKTETLNSIHNSNLAAGVVAPTFKTEYMLNENINLNKKAYDLLSGFGYFLGGNSYDDTLLWYVMGIGALSMDYSYKGVRPVLTLNSGVTISSSNTGDGSSEAKAYTLE